MKEVGPKNGTIENGYYGQEERERERVKRWVQKRELCVFVSKKMGTKERAVCVPRLAGAGHCVCVCACVHVCVCGVRERM